MLGYRPVDECAAFSTHRTPDATRSSLETRSISAWSITAMSPGRRPFTSRFVRFPSRAEPVNSFAPADPFSSARVRLGRPVSRETAMCRRLLRLRCR
jgi:hypothetical protein